MKIMNCPECAKYTVLLKVLTLPEYRLKQLIDRYVHQVKAHADGRCETCERKLRLMREYVNFSDETRYLQAEAELLDHHAHDHGVGIAAGLFPGREVRIAS